jgi:hypothetical protein
MASTACAGTLQKARAEMTSFMQDEQAENASADECSGGKDVAKARRHQAWRTGAAGWLEGDK